MFIGIKILFPPLPYLGHYEIKCQSTLTEHYYWNSIRGPIHQLEAKSDPVSSQQFAFLNSPSSVYALNRKLLPHLHHIAVSHY